MRAFGVNAESASDIDLVAPGGSRVRTSDVSEETGQAFHAGRFLGTAPSACDSQASCCLCGGCVGLPIRLAGTYIHFELLRRDHSMSPPRVTVSVSLLTDRPKPACENRLSRDPRVHSSVWIACLSRLRRTDSPKPCRGPKPAADAPNLGKGTLCNPPFRTASCASGPRMAEAYERPPRRPGPILPNKPANRLTVRPPKRRMALTFTPATARRLITWLLMPSW